MPTGKIDVQAKTPPHNADAETAILAAMLFDKEALARAVLMLTAEDFYSPANGEIFNAMTALHLRKEPVELVLLATELERRAKIHNGREMVIGLGSNFLTSAHVGYHIEEVLRHSETRRITCFLTELLSKPDGVTASDLKSVAETVSKNRFVKDYSEISNTSIDSFISELGHKSPRLFTGMSKLDTITGGIRIPSVFTIGAYPSTGNTTLAINIASNQENPVVFFSLEMSAKMIYERMASGERKIDYGHFNEQKLTESEVSEAKKFGESLKSRKFYVFDDVYYIEKQMEIASNIKPCLVVVDYIQKVWAHKKCETKRLETDYISAMYKLMASQNGCVVITLSQFSRPDSKGQKSPRPTMFSLKESGGLEADGDYVAILFRPHVHQKDNPEIKPETGYLLLDKNKFGKTGKIDLHFDGRHQKFYCTEKNALSYVDDGTDLSLPF